MVWIKPDQMHLITVGEERETSRAVSKTLHQHVKVLLCGHRSGQMSKQLIRSKKRTSDRIRPPPKAPAPI